jgi:hypothetical protein
MALLIFRNDFAIIKVYLKIIINVYFNI